MKINASLVPILRTFIGPNLLVDTNAVEWENVGRRIVKNVLIGLQLSSFSVIFPKRTFTAFSLMVDICDEVPAILPLVETSIYNIKIP